MVFFKFPAFALLSSHVIKDRYKQQTCIAGRSNLITFKSLPSPRHARRFATSSNAPPSSSQTTAPSREKWVPPSVATVIDSATGSKIYIVGCVHGSKISAEDVRKVLDVADPDAVVLELCEPRLKALRKTVVKKVTGELSDVDLRSRRRKSFKQMEQTFGGLGPALIASFLEKIYDLQILVGVDPGIEFVEPIIRFPSNRIVCGDALAKDTVSALFSALTHPLRSIGDCFEIMRDILTQLFFPPDGAVSLLFVFLRSPARLFETLKLILPLIVTSMLISAVGNASALAFDLTSVFPDLFGFLSGPWVTMLSSTLQALLSAYSAVALLLFLKVLIADRDQVLSASISSTALRFAEQKSAPVTLCVVVGMMHVNGILSLLQERNKL